MRKCLRFKRRSWGIVKLKLTAVFDAQHGGFTTGWSPASWGSIDELFVNLTMPAGHVLVEVGTASGRESTVTVEFSC